MPICFILIGVFLISYLFGLVSNKFLKSFIFLPVALLILLGYFYGDFFLSVFTFNIFHLIACVFLLFKIFANKLIVFRDIFYTSIICVIYYLIASNDLSLLLSYNLSVFVQYILVLISITRLSFSKSISLSFFSSLSIAIISAFISLDNFNVFSLDFTFVIEVFVLSVFLLIFKDVCLKLFLLGGNSNDFKKSYMLNNSHICKHVFISF